MVTRLILVRHAEAVGNYTRVFHGWTDSELTSRGHIQAEKVAKRLKNAKIDVIYSSSLKRTLQTAGYIAEQFNLPVLKTEKLKEIHGGDWEGVDWDQLSERWPTEYNTWENSPHVHQMPNGENMEEFQSRLAAEIMNIINANIGKTICVVTHGTAIKALLCWFRRSKLEEMCNIPWCDNTAVSIIDYENGTFNSVLENDASHLDKETSTLQNQDWWIESQNR